MQSALAASATRRAAAAAAAAAADDSIDGDGGKINARHQLHMDVRISRRDYSRTDSDSLQWRGVRPGVVELSTGSEDTITTKQYHH